MIPPLWAYRGNFHLTAIRDKQYLRNKSVRGFKKVAERYFTPQIKTMVYKEMAGIIELHRSRGDLLLLLTGTLYVIAECFADELRFDGFRATDLEVRNGVYTGRTTGTIPYGFGKLEVLREFRHTYSFDQNHTTLYANLFSDRYVMNAVEVPVAVNPDKRLRRYAQENRWRIIDVKKEKLARSVEHIF